MSKSLGMLKCEVRHGTPIQFIGSTGIYRYHNENIPVIEIKWTCFRFTASSMQKVKVTKIG